MHTLDLSYCIVAAARRATLAGLGIWAAVLFAGFLSAQETEPAATSSGAKTYRQWPMDNKLSNSRNAISSMLRGGLAAGQEKLLEDYYRKYVLAEWTIPKNYPKLPKLRQRLDADLASARNEAARDRLHAMLIDILGEMARADDLHPAVRFNAVLMIGELNVRPPAMGQVPAPLPAALDPLLAWLEDEKQIDAVRFGALMGIVRHATLGIADEASQKRVAAVMLKLATTTEAPGRSREGHAWMRARAIDLLGHFKSPGQDGAVAKALVAILDEPRAPFSVRAAAAEALGNLKLSPQAGLKAIETAASVGRLALDACRDAIDKTEKENRPPDPRTLKTRLVAVRVGLTGSMQITSGTSGGVAQLATTKPDKDHVADIRRQVEIWIGKLDDKDLVAKAEQPAGGPGALGMPGRGMGLGMEGEGRGMPVMGPEGGMPGGMGAGGTQVETTWKRILAEIKADLDKFEKLLEPAGA